MNRPIKFRAWDGERMYPVEEWTPAWVAVPVQVGEEEWGLEQRKLPETELMQFTGLLDKNGKEIYQGDLLEDEEDGSFNYVEWSETHAGWTTNEWFTPLELSQQSRRLEIIGNIFENPELTTPS